MVRLPLRTDDDPHHAYGTDFTNNVADLPISENIVVKISGNLEDIDFPSMATTIVPERSPALPHAPRATFLTSTTNVRDTGPCLPVTRQQPTVGKVGPVGWIPRLP